jgi:hypothetical protein
MSLLKRVASVCTPDRVRVYPPVVAGLFFAIWAASYAVMRKSAILDGFGRFLGNDFMAFYTGVRLWMAGRADVLYDFEVQQAFQVEQAGQPIDFVIPFISPPNALWVYAPFAQGSYLSGLLLWWAVHIAGAVGAAWLVRRDVSPGLAAHLTVGQQAAVCLCFMPTLMWLSFGQATGLVLLIWAGSLALLARGRDFSSGLVLALLAFKPQLALGPALVMAGGRRWAALAGGALGLGVWGGLTAWQLGPQLEVWIARGPKIAELLRADEYARWGVHSLYGFFNLLVGPLSPGLASALTGLGSLTLIGAGLWAWRGAVWAPQTADWRARAAVTLVLGSLSGLHLFVYDAMLWLIPLWLVLPDVSARRPADSPTPYLDGGPVLAWTGLVFWTTFLSGPLVQGQWAVMDAVGLPQVALQPSTLCVLGWCHAVWPRRDDMHP